MDKVKELLNKLYNMSLRNSDFYDTCIELIHYYWGIRKKYPYGEKVIGIIFYHDFIACANKKRNAHWYLDGKYNYLKSRTDVFPDWEKHLQEMRDIANLDEKVIDDGLENLKKFVETGILPAFNGYYRTQYFRFVLDEKIGDYRIDLSVYEITDDFSKELYDYIKANPLDFLDEIRHY